MYFNHGEDDAISKGKVKKSNIGKYTGIATLWKA